MTSNTASKPTPKIMSSVVKVTPKMAEGWLAGNLENQRTLSKRRVIEFAEAMKAGEWAVTHQGIAFNTDGKLIDGQHRLSAVVESGCTVEMMVFKNASRFDLIDIGAKRTNADLIQIDGSSAQVRAVASCLRLIDKYYTEPERPWRGSFPAYNVVKYARKHGAGIAAVTAAGGSIKSRIGAGSPAAYISALYITRRWALANGVEELWDDWADGFVTGANLDATDMRIAIGRWINGAGKLLQGTRRTEVLMMVCIKAFNSYVSSEPITRVQIANAGTWAYRLPGDNAKAAVDAWVVND